ncbi:ubiquitin 3 binding protein But2 C-terminal domain-containing protein [Xylogone sp. PMI_703]|nr:ubiquitin 3 binding protein But2 C-terminal domain-containing protein [Xylogone sp. PMI_703]
MKFLFASILVAAGTSTAAILPQSNSPCYFSLIARGFANGSVSEDPRGQLRIGAELPQGEFTFNNGTTMTDQDQLVCYIDPTTYQVKCGGFDTDAQQFVLGDNGYLLAPPADPNWIACPVSDGGYLIYSEADLNRQGCGYVVLITGGWSCAALGRPSTATSTVAAPSSPSTPAPTSAPASTSSTSPSCPTDIAGVEFQFPHLIVPTSSEEPMQAFGNSYTAHISPTNTTLFNFDIPASYSGRTCSLLFLFPFGNQLDPSAGGYTFSGIEQEVEQNGGLDFALLDGIANNGTTYATTPKVHTDYGKTEILPGNRYTIATYPCQGGQTLTYSVSSRGGVELDYFQDSAPAAIGLYIVPC